MDREKRSVNSGDEPGLLNNQVVSDPSVYAITLKTLTESNAGNNGGYVPTVGRCGNEWPSRLENTSLGEQRWLSPRAQPNNGVRSNQTVSGNRALAVSNATPKWLVPAQLSKDQLLSTNRCRVDVVGAQTDTVTTDDLAIQLQLLLKPKWTIDEDTYNLDAFDQCNGAWPIEHPLPLPLWSDYGRM